MSLSLILVEDLSGIKKVIVFMFDFKNIRDSFGDNPFSEDLQNGFITETTKPYRQGDTINFNGINYTCQSDIPARSPVLLILNGQIAVGETISPVGVNSERLVLDRKVSLERVREREKIPYLWSVTFSNRAYYTCYGNPVRVPKEVTRLVDSDNLPTNTNWFIWVNQENRVYTLGFSNGGVVSALAFSDASVSEPSFNQTDLNLSGIESHSFSNSWLWVPTYNDDDAIFTILITNTSIPSLQGGLVYLLDNQESAEAVSYNDIVNFFTSDLGSGATRTDWSGTVSILPTLKEDFNYQVEYPYLYNRDTGVLSPQQERFTHLLDQRHISTNYYLPRLVDTENNRAIVYEALNYKLNFKIDDFSKDDENICTKYKINYDELGAFYYDYEENSRTPIRSFGPYSIPLTNGSLQGIKESYNVGDTLSINYPAEIVGQGFSSDSGHYKTDPNNSNLSIICDVEEYTIADEDSIRDPECEFGTITCADGSTPTLAEPGQAKGAEYWITIDFTVSEKEGDFQDQEDFLVLTKKTFDNGDPIYGPISAPTVVTETVNGRDTDRLLFRAYRSQSDGENETNIQDLYVDPYTINSFTFGETQQSVNIISFDRLRYSKSGDYDDIPDAEKNLVCANGEPPYCDLPECTPQNGLQPPQCRLPGDPPPNCSETVQLWDVILRVRSSSTTTFTHVATIRVYSDGPPTNFTIENEGPQGTSGRFDYQIFKCNCRGFASYVTGSSTSVISWAWPGSSTQNRFIRPNGANLDSGIESSNRELRIAAWEGNSFSAIYQPDPPTVTAAGSQTIPLPEGCPVPPAGGPNPGQGNPNPQPGDPGFPENPYENGARQEELDYFNSISSTPFEAWGYIPNSNDGMVAVKVQVNSFNLAESEKGTTVNLYTVAQDYHAYVPFVDLRFLQSVQFSILEVYGTVTNGNPIYENLKGDSTWQAYNTSITETTLVPNTIRGYTIPDYTTKGYLFYGNSLGMAFSSALENPESVLMNIPLRADRLFNRLTPRGQGVNNYVRHIWQKSDRNGDQLWTYPVDMSYVTSDNPKIYVPEFKFELNQGVYDLVFQKFVELDLSDETNVEDISFHMNDKDLRRPRRR